MDSINPNTNYEIIAISLGVIAIIIAIVAFARQEKWNKRVERMTKEMNEYNAHHKKIEDSIKEQSLKSLRVRLNLIKHHFELIMSELEKQPNLEGLNRLIHEVGFGKVFGVNSRGLQRHADNLKFLIINSFHAKIERLSRGLSTLSNLDNINTFPNGYELWMVWAQKDREIIDELHDEIEKELKSKEN